MRRIRAVVSLLALAATASACAGPAGAVAIPSDEVPFSVARSAEPERPTAPTARYTLSFIRRGHLVDVPRDLSTRAPQESVMIALLDGPTDREGERGITTEIPPETRLLQVEVVNRVAQVNLSREFQTAGSSESVLLRVGEVVRTLTSSKGVDAVSFLIDGIPVSVPTDTGVVERPVTAADYVSINPTP
ncbi:MAG: GerMN domain-containing protein [Actinomycetota bacterium]